MLPISKHVLGRGGGQRGAVSRSESPRLDGDEYDTQRLDADGIYSSQLPQA